MNKTIPFRKEIPFETNIYEITSISLEHTLNKDNNKITGNFIVSGEYKVTDTSVDVIPYNYDLPFTIDMDLYDIKDSTIDIDNFYYEILDNKILVLNIDVRVDNIKELVMERDTTDMGNEILEALNTSEEPRNIDISIFSNLDKDDNYVNYKVYIIRENDNLDSIMSKYNVSKDILEEYNDLTNIKLGDKIIIPYAKN